MLLRQLASGRLEHRLAGTVKVLLDIGNYLVVKFWMRFFGIASILSCSGRVHHTTELIALEKSPALMRQVVVSNYRRLFSSKHDYFLLQLFCQLVTYHGVWKFWDFQSWRICSLLGQLIWFQQVQFLTRIGGIKSKKKTKNSSVVVSRSSTFVLHC